MTSMSSARTGAEAPKTARINEILRTNRVISPRMFKKLLLGAAIVVGLIYGSGNDFGTIKRHILSAANENARSVTHGDHNGWGDTSGY